MMKAAEQKQERRFLQLDRRYASTKPTHVRIEEMKLVNKATTVRPPVTYPINHTAKNSPQLQSEPSSSYKLIIKLY